MLQFSDNLTPLGVGGNIYFDGDDTCSRKNSKCIVYIFPKKILIGKKYNKITNNTRPSDSKKQYSVLQAKYPMVLAQECVSTQCRWQWLMWNH